MSDRDNQSAAPAARHVVIIGAGPAGMRAALDLADLGSRVTLVERKAAPGGVFTQLDVQYPTIDCGACQIQDSLAGPPWPQSRCLRTGVHHPLIETLTSARVIDSADAESGGLSLTIEQGSRWIDPALCTGCGDCVAVCPVEAIDEHQAGTCTHRAVYRPHLLTDPPLFVIDEAACTRCGDCLPACPEDAIELGRGATTKVNKVLEADAVIVAAGFESFDPALQPQWGWERHPDVVTGLELERMIRPRPEGGLEPLRRQDGSLAKRVAFVQCVGSRDLDHPWCSSICCMHALKEAIVLREQLDVPECHIYAIDLRCVGKGYEQTIERARAAGVRIVHARPGAVEATIPTDRPSLRVDGDGLGQSRETYDIVVLSTGLGPAKGLDSLAAILGIELNEHGFVDTTGGVTTTRPDVFVCGAAAGPADLPWSITSASQAAMAAATHLALATKDKGLRVLETSASVTDPPPQGPRNVPLTDVPRMSDLSPSPSPDDGVPVVQRALVLGAGPAGLNAARVLARAGYETIVVERKAEPGGHLREARRLMSGGDPEAMLHDLLADLEDTGKIELLCGWQLTSHSGGPGRYVATLHNERTNQTRRVVHGAWIVATGARELIPSSGTFGYSPARPTGPVITQRAFENLLAEGWTGAGAHPTVVMIQCVGSREPDHPVCSRVCCHEAIKNALWLTERVPGARVLILHRDIRTTGFDEPWFELARTRGVVPIRIDENEPPRVEVEEDSATVRLVDPLLGRALRIKADLVVLSTGMRPNLPTETLRELGLESTVGGFLKEANVKFRPVEASRRGALTAGTAVAPVLIPEAVAQGEAAALRAIALLSRDRVVPRPGAVAYRAKWCAACGLCVEVCPTGARELVEVDDRVGAIVHAGLCLGCGGCAAACPSGCTDQPALDAKGVMFMIDTALEVMS